MTTQRGFTLLEVLVAMAILALAVVSLIQLSAQGLRLLKLSGDYQEAILLADRLAREHVVISEEAATGQEGTLTWQRRVAEAAVPPDLDPPSGPAARLLTLRVVVRWGRHHAVEVATLRTVAPPK